MQTTTLTFEQTWNRLREIETYPVILLTDIPDVLRDDYRRFILGFRSASLNDIFGDVSTREFEHWIKKLKGKGLDYPVKFKPESDAVNYPLYCTNCGHGLEETGLGFYGCTYCPTSILPTLSPTGEMELTIFKEK